MDLMKVYIHIVFAMLPFVQSSTKEIIFLLLVHCIKVIKTDVDKAVFLLSFVLCVYAIVYQIINTMSICSLTVV